MISSRISSRLKDIKAGEEITCAYINCEQERKERQNELEFGWNFICKCDRWVIISQECPFTVEGFYLPCVIYYES